MAIASKSARMQMVFGMIEVRYRDEKGVLSNNTRISVVGQFEIRIADFSSENRPASMDKAQRADLLRSRFKAKGGLPYLAKITAKPMRHQETRRPIVMAWPECEGNTSRAPRWLKAANPELSLGPKPERRRKGDTALTRIARKWRSSLISSGSG